MDVEAPPGDLGVDDPEQELIQEELDSSLESSDEEDSENDEVGDESIEEQVKVEDSSSPQDNSRQEKSSESCQLAACFGSGTFSSPMVKFYFTAPCPQLGIEAGAEPSLGGRPAFMASQKGFTCR